MAKKKIKKVIVTEHILEVRHDACGKFLNVSGYVADHIRASELFPHWQIDTNVVSFRDDPVIAKKVGAFAGYKSAGLYANDPDSRNFFEDKATKYWKELSNNQFYTIPKIKRFGCRTRAFLNSDLTFEEINSKLYDKFFSKNFTEVIGGKENDFQVVLELTLDEYNAKLTIGPIHEKEAYKYFNFDSIHFEESGLYIDIDLSKKNDINTADIPKLTKQAMKISWDMIDKLSNEVGC